MIEHIQAVIFDIDGTLVDSNGMWGEIDEEYFKVLEIPMPPTMQATSWPILETLSAKQRDGALITCSTMSHRIRASTLSREYSARTRQ